MRQPQAQTSLVFASCSVIWNCKHKMGSAEYFKNEKDAIYGHFKQILHTLYFDICKWNTNWSNYCCFIFPFAGVTTSSQKKSCIHIIRNDFGVLMESYTWLHLSWIHPLMIFHIKRIGARCMMTLSLNENICKIFSFHHIQTANEYCMTRKKNLLSQKELKKHTFSHS